MMERIIAFSIKYPVTILMIVCAILLFGSLSVLRLNIELFPNLNNPKLYLVINAAEKPPKEIEKKFVIDLESLINRKNNVTQITSVSRVGSAYITVQYKTNTDMDNAYLELQKTVSNFLQNHEIDEYNIYHYDPNSEPIVILSLSNPDDNNINELRKITENFIRNELIRLDGIADVELLGEEEDEIAIEINEDILEQYDISFETITNKIKAYNQNISSGYIINAGKKYLIKGINPLQDIEDFGNIIIKSVDNNIENSDINSTNKYLCLKNIAEVRYNKKRVTSIVRVNRERCLAIAIYKESRYNTVKAVATLMSAIDKIKQSLPDYQIDVIQNQGNFITSAVNQVKETIVYGILLSILILYLFVNRVDTTIIICTAIPISVITAFCLIYFNGLSLNIMTLGGLALGGGMLVDNAVIVVENIYRNMESNESLSESIIKGTSQVSKPIISSTITTIIVFLPIIYLHGTAGELFKHQAYTVAYSLLSSLFVALFVIPMFSSKIIKNRKIENSNIVKFNWYPSILSKTLANKWYVVVAAFLITAISISVIFTIGKEFMPQTNVDEISIELELPEGTEIRTTEKTIVGIEDILYSMIGAHIKYLYTSIGSINSVNSTEVPLTEEENDANIKIILNEDHGLDIPLTLKSISEQLSLYKNFNIKSISTLNSLKFSIGLDDPPIVIEVDGEDLDLIQEITEKVKSRLQQNTNLTNITTNFEEGSPEVNINIDILKAGFNSLNIAEIISFLKSRLLGVEIDSWYTKNEPYDIAIRLPDIDLKQLYNLMIVIDNKKFRLGDIAQFEVSNSPREIYRRNQVRVGKVVAEFRKNVSLDKIISEIQNDLQKIPLQPRYNIRIAGDEQFRKVAFGNLKFALILSIILVYMVLASQFESLLYPFMILITIPFAFVGAILLYYLFGKTLNIMSYIGFIMLVGIAINDSIILIDTIIQCKNSSSSLEESVITACKQRIRPIIMTSLTTIFALLPLTLGIGEGAALQSSMALIVIGGLISSTALTLFVIPCVFLIFEHFKSIILRRPQA